MALSQGKKCKFCFSGYNQVDIFLFLWPSEMQYHHLKQYKPTLRNRVCAALISIRVFYSLAFTAIRGEIISTVVMVTLSLYLVCIFHPQQYVILFNETYTKRIFKCSNLQTDRKRFRSPGGFCHQVNFLLSWTTRHILPLPSVNNIRERCPGLSNEMNNHISMQKNQRQSYQSGGLERTWQRRGEGIFNLEDCFKQNG